MRGATYIGPSQYVFAHGAVNIAHCVQARNKHAIFGRSRRGVHGTIEQVGTAIFALKRLGDYFVAICQVTTAVSAGVDALCAQVSSQYAPHSAAQHGPRARGSGGLGPEAMSAAASRR